MRTIVCVLIVAVAIVADAVASPAVIIRAKIAPAANATALPKLPDFPGLHVDAAPQQQVKATFIFLDVRCDEVPWNGRCDGGAEVTSPTGWVVCKPIFDASGSNYQTSVTITISDIRANDGQSPHTFRTIRLHMNASGGFNPLDRRGVNLDVTGFGMVALPEDSTVEERRAEHCLMDNAFARTWSPIIRFNEDSQWS